MRFLILTQYFYPEVGAAPTRLLAMCKELKSLGHEVEVLTTMPNYPQGRIFDGFRGKFYLRDKVADCVVHRYWTYAGQGKGFKRMLAYLIFTFIACFGIIRCRKPDWVFVNSGPMFLCIPGYLASLAWQVPMNFNVADLWPDSIFKIKNVKDPLVVKFLYWLEKFAYTRSKKVTAITDGVKDVLINEKNVPEEKICFLPNGVDLDIFSPREADQEIIQKHNLSQKFVFCYPGTHGYLHALEKVLDAAKLLKFREDIVIMLIGGGSEKNNLLKKAEDEQINNVLLIDPLSQKELARYLSVIHCGLIHQRNTPLANETRPAKVFPIMAMQKPILFSGFGEGAQMIEKSGAGLVVPPEDPEVLSRTIESLAKVDDSLLEMGKRGRNYVEEHFSWKPLVKNWVDQL